MAVNIGPRIGVQGEQEYRKQLNNIITQTKTLHAEMRTLESSFDNSTSAQEKARKKGELLTKSIDTQEKEIAEISKALDASSKKYGENDTRTLKWKQALANAETELNNMRKQLSDLPNKVQALGMDMQAAGEKIQNAGKKISSVGSTLTKTVTAPIMAVGALAIKTAADFDASMSKVAAVSGATGQDFEDLQAKAREMGATTKFSASEAAEAMNYMAMAGWKTEDMMNGIEGIMSLAAASGADLATTSDIVTDALTAFGQTAAESGRLADIMAAASSNANTNVEMMGETFKYAAPVAGALGYSMEDTALVTGLMANAGIKASQAGTAMRRGFSNLVKPTKQVQEAMDKYGISLTDADGNMKDLRTVVKDLRKRLGGLDEAEQASAASAIFGTNAFSAWLAVINGADSDFEKLEGAIDNAEGTAKGMAETMQDNLAGQLTILKSQLEELAISFGSAVMPTVRKAVTAVQGFVDKLNSMDESTRENIIKFAAFAAAAGPVVLVVGKLVTAFGGIVKGIGTAMTAIGGLGGALSALPFVGAIAAAGLLGAAVKKIKDKYDIATPAAVEFSQAMSNSVSETAAARKELTGATDDITESVESATQKLDGLQASATLAREYGDELVALAGKSNLNNAEWERAKYLIDQIKTVYPEFTVEIDENAKSIKTSTEEIEKQIKALEKQAKAQAMQEIIEEIQKKIVDAEKKRIEAEQELKDLTEDNKEASDNYTKILEAQEQRTKDIEAAQTEYNAAVKNFGSDSKQALDAMDRLSALEVQREQDLVNINGEMVNAKEALNAYSQAQYDAGEETKKTNEAIAAAKQASADAQEQVAAYREEAAALGLDMETLGVAEEEAADSTGTLAEAQDALQLEVEETEEVIDEATKKIQDDYAQAYQSAYDSTMGQSGLFQELEAQEATSLSAMQAGLQSHIEALTTWNANASELMSSERYATDATFRAMVDSIIQAGDSMAPELAAITEAFRNGDAELETLVGSYGEMQTLASSQATSLANAKISAEYGIEALQEVYGDGTVPAAADKMVADTNKAMSGLDTDAAAGELLKPIETMTSNTGAAKEAAQGYANSIGTGIEAGDTKIDTVSDDFTQTQKEITKQQSQASTTGRSVAESYGRGVTSGKMSVQTALQGLRTLIYNRINAITPDTKTKGQNISENLSAGINQKKGAAATAASSLASGVSTPITNIASAATTWGLHLGNNFAAGIRSARNNAVQAAQETAQAIADVLKHSTPKKGPLANDDVWGLHLAQNFAAGMNRGAALVGAASVNLAERAVISPNATADLNVLGGGGALLDPAAIYRAVYEGAAAAETNVVIGNREFARILRQAGVATA